MGMIRYESLIGLLYILGIMQIPESEKNVNDGIDLLIEASHVKRLVKDEAGIVHEELIEDPKILYYQSRSVNSSTYGRYVFEAENLLNKAEECFFNMCERRAVALSEGIKGLVRSYSYGIDGKSSETKRDKNNNQTNVLGWIFRNRVERLYNVKGEASRSILAGLTGRDVEKDQQQDG